MDGSSGVSGAAEVATAGVGNAINLNVLKDTQNLSEDLINQLFSSIGLGANVSTHA
ncbi:MAG: hypothetical protein NVSMB64_24800 [Candidatus Velthaea sp.]